MNPFDLIQIKKCDITTLSCDTIVNAANSSLLGSGGVDGVIHRVAKNKLLDECREIRKTKYPHGLATGKAVLTNAYNLPSKYVINTGGPIWQGGNCNEPQLLSDCYNNSLKIAKDIGLSSVAFPAISTNVYHYPKELAVKIALNSVIKFITNEQVDILIIFALNNTNFEIYNKNIEGKL